MKQQLQWYSVYSRVFPVFSLFVLSHSCSELSKGNRGLFLVAAALNSLASFYLFLFSLCTFWTQPSFCMFPTPPVCWCFQVWFTLTALFLFLAWSGPGLSSVLCKDTRPRWPDVMRLPAAVVNVMEFSVPSTCGKSFF